jgi:hypothetical protein
MPDLGPSRLLTTRDIARCHAAHPADVGPPDPAEAYYLKLLRQAPELEWRDGTLFVCGIPRHVRSDSPHDAVPPPRRGHTVATAFDIAFNIMSPDPIEHLSPLGQSREVWRRACLICAAIAKVRHPALFDYMLLAPDPERLFYLNIAPQYREEYITFFIYAKLSEGVGEAIHDALEARYPDDDFPISRLDPCGRRPGWPRRPRPPQDEEEEPDAPLRSLWWWWWR